MTGTTVVIKSGNWDTDVKSPWFSHPWKGRLHSSPPPLELLRKQRLSAPVPMTIYKKFLLWASSWGSTLASVSPATAGGQILGKPAIHLPLSEAQSTFPVAQFSLVPTPPGREGCQVHSVEMDLLLRTGVGAGLGLQPGNFRVPASPSLVAALFIQV